MRCLIPPPIRKCESSSMSSSGLSLVILLLTVSVVTTSGILKWTLTPDRGTTLSITSRPVKGCKVCTVTRGPPQCNTSLLLNQHTPVSVEFQCPKPQDVFSVEIVRNIECTAKSCSGHIVQADSLPLLLFNRKYTWNLNASATKAFKIDFTGDGLRQIDPSGRCPDRHSYTLQTSGKVTVGKFCRTGPIQSAQILSDGRFSLDVPAGQKLQNGQFHVSVGEEIKSLAKITLAFPKGTSSLVLLSPNYPDSFPDSKVVEWYFQVPDKYKTTIELLPRCLMTETTVEYPSQGGRVSKLKLSNAQQEQTGNFSLMLRNCKMDRGRAGLSLNLKVSSSSTPVSCKVDVSTMGGLYLHIEKLRSASGCEMKVNSVLKEKFTVTSVSELTFQDCLPEDIQITATRLIECSQLKDCPNSASMSVPQQLPSCLPAPLSNVTWTFHLPEDGTVEFASSMGLFKQSLPGQPCNDSIVIDVAEDDGAPVGRFCPQGTIQTIEIQANVSITVSGIEFEAPRRRMSSLKPVMTFTLKDKIPERYIFTVFPKKDAPVLLASPGWPSGMKPESTVSWLVSVPQKMEAHLMFDKLKQPKCSKLHTGIKVQRVGYVEEDYSRREDEEAKSQITVSESFFLNMSNCLPEKGGHFSVVTKITLQNSTNLLLTIILSVVATLLVIFVIVLVVVCVVIRKKKKKKLDHQVSVYNPNGTVFLPGQNGTPGTHEDDDVHEYASIEDTLVYTHLLRQGREMGVYGEFDKYRPFTGHNDSQKPLVPKDAGTGDTQVEAYQRFQSASQAAPPLPIRPLSHGQRIVDNEIYQTEGQSEEERSPSLGPRLEPEGGN